MTQLWIAAGGALGSLLRYWITLLAVAWLGERMPWGTILINVTGSFLIGAVAALAEPGSRWMLSPDVRLFLMVGVCGGYTTFSAFSLQTLALFQAGDPARAMANIALSLIACLAAVWAGHALGTLAMGAGRA